MRYVQFQVVEDENHGGAGILPNIHRNWINYSPSVGVAGLAHDILEHGSNETGAFHEEIAAHGSWFFVRLLTGHVDVWSSCESVAASGMAEQWAESRTDYIPEPPKVFFLSPDENDMLDEFLPKVRRELAKQYSKEYSDFDLEPKCPYTTNETWPKMVNWYKYGYARAKRRYRGNDDIAYLLFRNVTKTIENNWEELKQYCDSGRKFTLVLDLDYGDVELRGLF
jgi:hypothetical protein